MPIGCPSNAILPLQNSLTVLASSADVITDIKKKLQDVSTLCEASKASITQYDGMVFCPFVCRYVDCLEKRWRAAMYVLLGEACAYQAT